MNYKTKSILYFAGLVIAAVTYYNIEAENAIQETELANNTIENVEMLEELN